MLSQFLTNLNTILEETEAFRLRGWGWLIILFFLYPIRHLFTRAFESFSLKIEFWLIKHHWLGFNSLKVHSVGVSYANTSVTNDQRRLKVNGTLVLINLLSVGNAIESINVEFQGKEYPLSWKDTHGGKPDSLAPRASRVAYFFATDMDWPFPPDKMGIEVIFLVRDMFGRVYAKTTICPVGHT